MTILEILIDFRNFLKGKKTYIVGILMIILGLLNNDQQMILQGFAVMTLRAGISNK